MTIYDVPVEDTVFFPVSGDMLRRMKHEEENGTGAPAKKSPDAADLNNQVGEQIDMNDTSSISKGPDVTWHPLWCNNDKCETTPGEYTHTSSTISSSRPSDRRLPGWDITGDISLLDWSGQITGPYASFSINDSEWVNVDSAGLTQLIGFLEALRARLQEA